MGSPDYAATILHRLADSMNVVGVITQPDKQVGRGKQYQSPPVKILADQLEIQVKQPIKLTTDEFIHTLDKWNPGVIVVAAYGKILRSDILNLPSYGCINVHASLLPRWRGASPIHAAIMNGDKTTGVTIMKMDEGIDTGSILSKKEIVINDSDTTGVLTDKLAILGAELLLDTLPKYLSGELIPENQPGDGATYAGLIRKQDGYIDFHESAEKLERRIRAFNPWPVCFFDWNGKNVKIFSASILPSDDLKPGQRGIVNKFPCIGTNTNDLKLLEIQIPGKQRIKGNFFLNGARNWVNE